MNPIDNMLPRLEKLKQVSQGKWIALCPAHGDRNPSLSVRELEDGKVLLKCWAGCSAEEIVSALGLHLRDLFPDSGTTSYGLSKRAIFHEQFVYKIGSALIAKGQQLSPADQARFELSRKRMEILK
ncbi:virulence-associated protein E [Ectopseudomonas mendocina]|nr:virulence-associated protein E [Pseudomonas mendocina]TRO23741.1 virulence-associated protein E [Pseudomonas mendocina]